VLGLGPAARWCWRLVGQHGQCWGAAYTNWFRKSGGPVGTFTRASCSRVTDMKSMLAVCLSQTRAASFLNLFSYSPTHLELISFPPTPQRVILKNDGRSCIFCRVDNADLSERQKRCARSSKCADNLAMLSDSLKEPQTEWEDDYFLPKPRRTTLNWVFGSIKGNGSQMETSVSQSRRTASRMGRSWQQR